MARILPDSEIEKLIDIVLIDADKELIDPNGIKLRLGPEILFHSTGEKKTIKEGMYVCIHPGESVMICSMEKIDFRKATVQKLLNESELMAFITPTTSMVREGVTNASTKIDTGFYGDLNWGLRNGSHKDLILAYGEPMFKLTIFELGKNEAPHTEYGGRDSDSYQETSGIKRSKRLIPADIPKDNLITSSFRNIDPKKSLRDAGYPFDHIGAELTALDGKFELVSSDVKLMQHEFEKQSKELSNKIVSETATLSTKLDETKDWLIEKAESLFDRKFLRAVAIIIGAIPILYGFGLFLHEKTTVGNSMIVVIFVAIGLIIPILAFVISSHSNTKT